MNPTAPPPPCRWPRGQTGPIIRGRCRPGPRSPTSGGGGFQPPMAKRPCAGKKKLTDPLRRNPPIDLSSSGGGGWLAGRLPFDRRPPPAAEGGRGPSFRKGPDAEGRPLPPSLCASLYIYCVEFTRFRNSHCPCCGAKCPQSMSTILNSVISPKVFISEHFIPEGLKN